jgi:hypothetical protein
MEQPSRPMTMPSWHRSPRPTGRSPPTAPCWPMPSTRQPPSRRACHRDRTPRNEPRSSRSMVLRFPARPRPIPTLAMTRRSALRSILRCFPAATHFRRSNCAATVRAVWCLAGARRPVARFRHLARPQAPSGGYASGCIIRHARLRLSSRPRRRRRGRLVGLHPHPRADKAQCLPLAPAPAGRLGHQWHGWGGTGQTPLGCMGKSRSLERVLNF